MVNGSAVKPEVSVDLNDQDVISIKDQFSWKYEFPVRACGSSKVEINEKMKATLKEYAREKFEQDQKLQEAAIKQVELTAEKEVLTKRLEEERLNQAKRQEEERLAWEIKLNATKEKVRPQLYVCHSTLCRQFICITRYGSALAAPLVGMQMNW